MNDTKLAGVRIRRRLVLFTILPLLALGLLATLLSAYGLWQVSLPLILQQNTSRAQTIAAEMSDNLDTLYLRPLKIAADSLAPYSLASEQQQSLQNYSAFLLNRFEGGVVLANTAGVVVAATEGQQARLGEDLSAQGFFQTVRSFRRPVLSAVYHDSHLDLDVVAVATPVESAGDLRGVLVGTMPLATHAWTRDLGPTFRAFGGPVYLLDVTGSVVFHPDPQLLGTSIHQDRTLSDLMASREAHSVVVEGSFLGRQVVASFAPIPGTYWGIITEERVDTIAPSLPYQIRVIGPLLGVMIGFLVVMLVAVSNISRPFVALIQEALRVSAGAPFGPLEAQGPIELRTLINTFNQLVSRLNEQQMALYQYSRSIVQSQEEERLRLSRELHDDTVQMLVGLAQRVELCRGTVEHSPTAMRARLDELQTLVQRMVADVRRMSNDLRPAILEDLGLSAALGALADELTQQMPTAAVSFEVLGEETRLEPDLELTAFRVAQEALHNVRRHAHTAAEVSLVLRFSADCVELAISDNGPGFPAADVREMVRAGHLGLVGMYERARMCGGEISIRSTPGEGTRVVLRLPRQAERPAATTPASPG